MTDLPRVVLLFGCVAVVVDDARALVAIPLRTEDFECCRTRVHVSWSVTGYPASVAARRGRPTDKHIDVQAEYVPKYQVPRELTSKAAGPTCGC